jgi:hypothetical protein
MTPRSRLAAALCLAVILLLSSLVTAQQAATGSQPPVSAVADSGAYLVLDGPNASGLYHRRGCPWLRGGNVTGYTVDEAKRRYFQPHCGCITGKEGVPPCEATPADRGTPGPSTAVPAATAAIPASRTSAPVAASDGRTRCAATTKKGTQCLRMASAGSAYCWQHQR